MSDARERLERLIRELDDIRQSAYWLEGEREAWLSKVHDRHRESARNLLHYLALRRRDIRPLQLELAELGLSSLGRSEAHVLGTLEQVRGVLSRLVGEEIPAEDDGLRPIEYAKGRALLAENHELLFGPQGKDREGPEGGVRVMVTMPTEAATNPVLVEQLVENGMDCMRINCAHDSALEWSAMLENLEAARKSTGRRCAVFMDVAGPKIRTGEIEPGPRVVRWEPKRDAFGTVLCPVQLWLTPAASPELPPETISTVIPIDANILKRLEPEDRMSFRDTRGRSRVLTIRSRVGESWIAESTQITYLGADCEIRIRPSKKSSAERTLPESFLPTDIPPLIQSLSLCEGDRLILTRDPEPARPSPRGLDGRLLEVPRIACSAPTVFLDVRPGERVLFDDGKIHGVIVEASDEELHVEITQPVDSPRKLKAFKGINLPDTRLSLGALTTKDFHDLDFICRHADIIGLSFVHRTQDVEELQREIFRRTSRPVGIVLKIETRRAFEQLPRLLLAALRSQLVGVMIARGDLAVECGFERTAELQEEILWICEAAHVPAIWATQVLERLSKKGMPTRAEVSDVVLAERAECVMLNKGPHIVDSLRMLRNILGRMREHRSKKSDLLRPLNVSLLPDPNE